MTKPPLLITNVNITPFQSISQEDNHSSLMNSLKKRSKENENLFRMNKAEMTSKEKHSLHLKTKRRAKIRRTKIEKEMRAVAAMGTNKKVTEMIQRKDAIKTLKRHSNVKILK